MKETPTWTVEVYGRPAADLHEIAFSLVPTI